MDRTFIKAALIIGLFGFTASTVLAHHSGAMFDTSKTLTVKGTVKVFQWTNPHVIAWVVADAKAGESPQLWRFELSSPGNLTRAGWTKRSLNPGDAVTVDCGPMRDGTLGGLLKKVTLANGQVLTFSFSELEKPGLQ